MFKFIKSLFKKKNKPDNATDEDMQQIMAMLNDVMEEAAAEEKILNEKEAAIDKAKAEEKREIETAKALAKSKKELAIAKAEAEASAKLYELKKNKNIEE